MTLGARLARVSFWAGSAGLLGAMLIDATAVLGRHLGVPLLGSIELVEACIVWMASASLVGTTLERGHASVHILTERLSPAPKLALRRAADLASALFFALIALGSAWLLFDVWRGDEQSELLHIPIAPLRALWCASVAGVVASFLAQAFTRQSRA